ncbi:MAG: polyphosphate kinase 1 [Acidobacteriota bacterium]
MTSKSKTSDATKSVAAESSTDERTAAERATEDGTPTLPPLASGRRRSPRARRPAARRPDFDRPELYLNRELSWLEFNRRVLGEAVDASNPLLERVKFLAIFTSNLDEFFMIRVSGLRAQLKASVLNPPPDGMTPAEQVAKIHEQLAPMLDLAAECWHQELKPQLAEHDIRILGYDALRKKQRRLLRRLFEREIFPALTPLAFDPSHPFPHISNLSINLAVVVQHPTQGERFARVKVPQVFPRLLRVPEEHKADQAQHLGLEELSSNHFVWLEEVIAHNLDMLFPACTMIASHPFRVTRDADVEIEEDEASDLLEAMEEVVGQRHFGHAVRIEHGDDMPESIRDTLVRNLGLAPYQTFSSSAPLGLSDLMQLVKVDRPELKDPPHAPHTPAVVSGDENIFDIIAKRDVLLFHPYDSFTPVVDFVRAAARDPKVLAIKQTLYRVGPDSPIVKALMEARDNGKQVAVLVELKARFDETNNIVWARALERAGVHVVYGVLGLKTHAKMALVVRREKGGTIRYVHLGTGNYNPVTARLYTDFGFFTRDEQIGVDVSHLFNGLTGYGRPEVYRKLLVAPRTMRQELLRRIDREIEHHRADGGGGHLIFKCNSLVDPKTIRALYKASNAGVRVQLQIRGICCLRPGVEGISENIEVTSLIGRFLEHPRAYWFRNAGEPELFLGSADLMPRNLDGRVEVLFPIEDPEIREKIRAHILEPHLADNQNLHRLQPDGCYELVEPAEGEEPRDAHQEMIDHPERWH